MRHGVNVMTPEELAQVRAWAVAYDETGRIIHRLLDTIEVLTAERDEWEERSIRTAAFHLARIAEAEKPLVPGHFPVIPES